MDKDFYLTLYHSATFVAVPKLPVSCCNVINCFASFKACVYG